MGRARSTKGLLQLLSGDRTYVLGDMNAAIAVKDLLDLAGELLMPRLSAPRHRSTAERSKEGLTAVFCAAR